MYTELYIKVGTNVVWNCTMNLDGRKESGTQEVELGHIQLCSLCVWVFFSVLILSQYQLRLMVLTFMFNGMYN